MCNRIFNQPDHCDHVAQVISYFFVFIILTHRLFVLFKLKFNWFICLFIDLMIYWVLYLLIYFYLYIYFFIIYLFLFVYLFIYLFILYKSVVANRCFIFVIIILTIIIIWLLLVLILNLRFCLKIKGCTRNNLLVMKYYPGNNGNTTLEGHFLFQLIYLFTFLFIYLFIYLFICLWIIFI